MSSSFDELSKSLTNKERQEMLNKIGDTIILPKTAAKNSYIEEEITAKPDIKSFISSIPVLTLMLIRVQSLFTSTTFEENVKIHMLDKLKAKIVPPYDKWVDFKKTLFLQPSYEAIKNLSDSIKLFKNPLENALVNQKKYFYAYLGGQILGEEHEELLKITSFEWVNEQCNTREYTEVREALNQEIKRFTEGISTEKRGMIKNSIHYFTNLHRLANFSFDRITVSFNRKYVCEAVVVINQVAKLSDILYNLTIRPSTNIFSYLFTFYYYNNKENFEINEIDFVKENLEATVNTLSDLQQMINFPLNYIIKIFKKDYFFEFLATYNGEEWFNLYQKFWQERIDNAIKAYLIAKKRSAAENGLNEILTIKGSVFTYIKNYSDGVWGIDGHPTYVRSLGFIDSYFKSEVFENLSKIMHILEKHGIFEWPDNRTMLLSTFSTFNEIHSKKIYNLVASMSEGGDLYKKIVGDGEDKTPEEAFLDAKQRYYAYETINRHAKDIILEFIDLTKTMILVLTGLVKGSSVDSRFSRLSNLMDLDDTLEISTLINKEREVLKHIGSLLTDLKNIEERFANKNNEYDVSTLTS